MKLAKLIDRGHRMAESKLGSTATSLDLQNWTTPQLIQNSQFAVTVKADADIMHHTPD
jgi:hypothetical protein